MNPFKLMKERWQVINWYIEAFGYKTYVEIGIDDGENYDKIKCEKKYGVDPRVKCSHMMTSDTFWKEWASEIDLIFIDGNHSAEYVERDIGYALQNLSSIGRLLVHDTNPNEMHRTAPEWSGDGYKVIAEMVGSGYNLFTLPIEQGLTVFYDLSNIHWCEFDLNRKNLLNLVDLT
jgi:hypothetical protein